MDVHHFSRSLGNWSSGRGPLSRRLTGALGTLIRNGELPPQSRLPAERALAQALAVSRSTIVAAYRRLEEDGFVETRRGSGTRVHAQAQAAVPRARGSAGEAELGGAPVIDLAMSGTPDFPDALLRDALAFSPPELAALRRDGGYQPLGLPAAREAIAAYCTELGVPTRSEEILVTSGAQQAVSLIAMVYLQRGDTVALENPTYYGAIDAFQAQGARFAPLLPDADDVRSGALRDALVAVAPRLIYVIPNYRNPTGTLMSERRRWQLAEIADDLRLLVVEDNTLGDLGFAGDRLVPLAALSRKQSVISVGSFSKLFWPGLRLGWIRAEAAVVQRIARFKHTADLGTSQLSQAVVIRLLTQLDAIRRSRRRQLHDNLDVLVAALGCRLPDWSFSAPTGGSFLWVRLPRGDARAFALVAARFGVTVLPGTAMSVDGSCGDRLRIPLSLSGETLALGVERLARAWQKYPNAAHEPEQADAIV